MRFWRAIFRLISRTTGIILSGTAEIVILGIHVERYTPSLRPILIQILMAAKLTITSKWKPDTSPNISDTIKKVDEAFKHEQIMVIVEGNLLCFYKQWDPWILIRRIA